MNQESEHFGISLRRARQKRALTLGEISSSTKVPRSALELIEEGKLDRDDNPLKHAPHTATMAAASEWTHAYPRELAVFPLATLRQQKYWPPVARVDNVYGDKNVFCSCVPMADYA